MFNRWVCDLVTRLLCRYLMEPMLYLAVLCFMAGVAADMEIQTKYLGYFIGVYMCTAVLITTLLIIQRVREYRWALYVFEVVEVTPLRLYKDYAYRDVAVTLSKLEAHRDVRDVLFEQFPHIPRLDVQVEVSIWSRIRIALFTELL